MTNFITECRNYKQFMSSKSDIKIEKPQLGSGPRNYQWYQRLNKSKLTPPQWVFPVVWTILYVMIIASGIRYLIVTNFQINLGLIFYFIQIFLNLIWSPIFFWKKWLFTALLDLAFLYIFVMANILFFAFKDVVAAWLLVPYVIWLSLATYLNWYIVFNNFEQLQFENLRQLSTPYQQQEYYIRGMQVVKRRQEQQRKQYQIQRLREQEQIRRQEEKQRKKIEQQLQKKKRFQQQKKQK